MIARHIWFLAFLATLMVVTICSPVSFPTERSHQIEDGGDSEARGFGEESDARTHQLNQEIRKRKRMRLACRRFLQQQNNQLRNASPQPVDGEGKTLLWGINYYDTNIYVVNGGYGGKPSLAPSFLSGASSNPCEGISNLGGISHLPSLPSNFPSLTSNFPNIPHIASNFPSIGNIGNEIIHLLVPGSTNTNNRPTNPGSSSSGIRPPSSGSPIFVTTTTTTTPSSGSDGDNEDYDYSDGASDGSSNTIKKRKKPAPSVDRLVTGFRPAADRYLEDYLFRPVDRTFKQIIRWF